MMRSPFRKTVLLLVIGWVFLVAGCSRASFVEPETIVPIPDWNGEDGKEIIVAVNCSAYGSWNIDWVDWYPTTFYLDVAQQTEVTGDSNDHLFKLSVPSNTTDLYIQPPLIALITELEEQTIPLNQTYPIRTEYFDIVSTYIPQLIGWNHDRDNIEIAVFLVSENKQYLDYLYLRYDGKNYPLSGRGWASNDSDQTEYICYTFVMPDLYTAAMALKYGSLYYTRLQTIITGDEVSYECVNSSIRIHVIKRD